MVFRPESEGTFEGENVVKSTMEIVESSGSRDVCHC